MAHEIKFSLIYRDMFQSSGKYYPRKDQLEKIAPLFIEMGCFDRVETNGGAFEQTCLIKGENPNPSVRAFTKILHDGGIECHMLERALNGITMSPVPADVRQLMFKVKKSQGVDIVRSFCGLNDHRNLELSVKYAKEAGLISQAALSITHSPYHTIEYYMGLVDKLVEYGTDEIALKDMAGIGRPVTLGKLVTQIKAKYPHIKTQYHGHSGPGFSVASMLEVARAGIDYIDVAMEPLPWGMVHPDIITIQAMLKDAGFKVKDINMKAYMKARALTQEFIDDFLGYWIEPSNKQMTSLLVGCGLPGGMMGSLMDGLIQMQPVINQALVNNGKSALSIDDLLSELFEEVEYVWPKLGYPPLVTPFSQYVKNIALFNILSLAQGNGRWQNIDGASWDMLLGKAGKLPGPLDNEIIELAKSKDLEFYDGLPQSLYPNKLEYYRKEMQEKGWDLGQDEEELFEFAMHDKQYIPFKTGIAAENFEKEFDDKIKKSFEPKYSNKNPKLKLIKSPISGQIILDFEAEDNVSAISLKKNDTITKDQRLFYVLTNNFLEVKSEFDGILKTFFVKNGDKVKAGDIIAVVEIL